jgi:multidrug transporter EmrE-like cation transporter
MSTALAPILPLGVGYGIVVGVGFLFALVMVGISMLQVRTYLSLCRMVLILE